MSNTLTKEQTSATTSYNGWSQEVFDRVRNTSWFDAIRRRVEERRKIETVYPAPADVFNAFKQCPRDEFKVLILGQDPYHSPGVADGMAFSTRSIVRPPSLGFMYQEINRDLFQNQYNFRDTSNDLTEWAQQGVLLLNTILTVKQGEPLSHAELGWDKFTAHVLQRVLYMETNPFVIMLWGKLAKSYREMFRGKGSNVLILEAPHPMSEGYAFSAKKTERFFGCGHFSKCNEFLQEKGRTPIDWLIHKQIF